MSRSSFGMTVARRWRRAAHSALRSLAAATSLDHGGAAVELGILLPLIATITFGAVDFARLFRAYVTVSNAAHQSVLYMGRYSAGKVVDSATLTDLTATKLPSVASAEGAGLLSLPSSATVGTSSCTPASGYNTCLTYGLPAMQTGDVVQVAKVTITYNFQPVTAIPFRGVFPITVSAVAPVPQSG